MLPGADSPGIAHSYLFSLIQCPHGIGDNPILGPVSSPDHIAGTDAGNSHGTDLEVGIPICHRRDLGHCLAGTVRIMTTKRITLLVRPSRLMVLVALVGCDDDSDYLLLVAGCWLLVGTF